MEALPELVKQFGLPIGILLTGFGLIITGVLRSGAQVDREIAIWKERFQDERKDRLDAESRLDESLKVTVQATDLAARYEKIVRENMS